MDVASNNERGITWDKLKEESEDEDDLRAELRRMRKERDENTTQKKIVTEQEFLSLEKSGFDMSKTTTLKRIAKKVGVSHVSESIPRVLQQIIYETNKNTKGRP